MISPQHTLAFFQSASNESVLSLYLIIYLLNLYVVCFFLSQNAFATNNLFKLVRFGCNNKRVAVLLLASCLSLAGVPPFSGFFTKLLLCYCVFQNYGLLISVCLYFIIFVSFFFYLRLIQAARKNTKLTKTDLREFKRTITSKAKQPTHTALFFLVFFSFINFFFFFLLKILLYFSSPANSFNGCVCAYSLLRYCNKAFVLCVFLSSERLCTSTL